MPRRHTEEQAARDADTALTLPSHVLVATGSLVGRRVTRVRRVLCGDDDGDGQARAVSSTGDARDGVTELTLDDGRLLLASANVERHSVALALGALPAADEPYAFDVSRDDFWRWRLRREITEVLVCKSLDVPPSALELEFGVELGLRFTPGFALEYHLRDGVGRLSIRDARHGERCRKLAVDELRGNALLRR